MCRNHLPVWQRFYEKNRKRDFEILSVAVDIQGADVVRPFVKKHGVTYPVVVDRDNLVAGSLLGFKVIPLVSLVDELGILRFKSAGGPSPGIGRRIEAILSENPESVAWSGKATGAVRSGPHPAAAATTPATARQWFLRGRARLDAGKRKEALESLHKALALDPEDFLIRKQIWALEHPERFYKGKIDFRWQQSQLRKERP